MTKTMPLKVRFVAMALAAMVVTTGAAAVASVSADEARAAESGEVDQSFE